MGRGKKKTFNPYEPQTFFPTLEEFQNFPAYIEYTIRKGASKAGACKIVPPVEYNPSDFTRLCRISLGGVVKQKLEKKNGAYVLNTNIPLVKTGKKGNKENKGIKYNLTNPFDYREFVSQQGRKEPETNTDEDLEREFWNQIDSDQLPLYASDTYGTAINQKQKYWNINSLNTILDDLKEQYTNVKGVLDSYLYFGSWRSIFPWHVEDYNLFSINYLHDGEPKFWYCIPPSDGHKFEAFVERLMGNESGCDAILRHKDFFCHPDLLRKEGIRVNKIVQHKGEIIITYPFGFHSGFNGGYNLAEATNFATIGWIDYAIWSKRCTCKDKDSLEIDLEPFIRRYRPEIYEKWINGEELGHHPETPWNLQIVPAPEPKRKTKSTSKEAVEVIQPQTKEQSIQKVPFKKVPPNFDFQTNPESNVVPDINVLSQHEIEPVIMPICRRSKRLRTKEKLKDVRDEEKEWQSNLRSNQIGINTSQSEPDTADIVTPIIIPPMKANSPQQLLDQETPCSEEGKNKPRAQPIRSTRSKKSTNKDKQSKSECTTEKESNAINGDEYLDPTDSNDSMNTSHQIEPTANHSENPGDAEMDQSISTFALEVHHDENLASDADQNKQVQLYKPMEEKGEKLSKNVYEEDELVDKITSKLMSRILSSFQEKTLPDFLFQFSNIKPLSSETHPMEITANLNRNSYTKVNGEQEVPSCNSEVPPGPTSSQIRPSHTSRMRKTEEQEHSQLKQYNCDKCVKSFQCQGALNKHKKNNHEGKQFICDKCEKKYSGVDTLREHMKNKHQH